MVGLALAADFQTGRASHYEYNNAGSCSYKAIFEDEHLGDPLHIMAIADCSDLYANSCGNCFEVKCRNAVIKDDNGVELDRTEACYDEKSSVVLRTVDACPSYYPANLESNSRWCRCQYKPLEHFDISSEAFSQLADVGIGVIGTSWRQVDCDAKPENPAKVRDTKRYANALPASSENQQRTQTDWTGLVASWVTVQDFQPLNPLQVNPPTIFSTAYGNLLPGWVVSDVMTQNAQQSETDKLDIPMPPVNTGRGGEGSPVCFWRSFGNGIGFSSNESTATNTTIVSFWVFTGNAPTVDMAVTIGQNNTDVTCDYVRLSTVPSISQNNGWTSYNLFVPSFNTSSDSKIFDGCSGHVSSDFDALYFLNSAPEPKWTCVDDVLWR